MADLLCSTSFTRMSEGVEAALDALGGHKRDRFSKFVVALHAAGFGVHELPGGPVQPKPDIDVGEDLG